MLTAETWGTHRIVLPNVSAYGIAEIRLFKETRFAVVSEWLPTGSRSVHAGLYHTLEDALLGLERTLHFWKQHRQYHLKLEEIPGAREDDHE